MNNQAYLKTQAKLMKAMRAGARYAFNHQLSHKDCSDLLAEIDTLKADASWPVPLEQDKEGVLRRRWETSSAMIEEGISHEAIAKTLEGELQLDLDNGEATLASSHRVVDYKKGLEARLTAAFEMLADEMERTIQKEKGFSRGLLSITSGTGNTGQSRFRSTDPEDVCVSIKYGERFGPDSDIIRSTLHSAASDAETEVVLASSICQRLAQGCRIVAEQYHDGNELPKVLRKHQAQLRQMASHDMAP